MANRSHEISKYTLSEGVPWLVVYICEAVLILTGNSITVYIFWNIRKRLKRTSYLLINLAVADFLVGIAITLFLWEAIAEMLDRDVSHGTVTTATMVDLIGTISSVLSMALISLERMLAILWPFRHRLLNAWYYHVSIGFIWLVSAVNVFSNLHLDPDTTKADNAYSILTATTYISSVVIIVLAYTAIWISTIRNQIPSDEHSQRQIKQNRKLTKTLCLVTALSVITCLPYAISIAFQDFLQHLYSFRAQITVALQYANSFLNPVVYCFKMPEFKASLRKLFCRCRRPLELPSFNTENTSETTSGVTPRSLRVASAV